MSKSHPAKPVAKSKSAKKPRRETAAAEVPSAAPADVVTLDRRTSGDRRSGVDRRQRNEPVAVERRVFQRREKVNRRRQIDPTTCERDYTEAEIEFMTALDLYKRKSGRMFPTCSEILEVLRSLGYEKRAPQPVSSEPGCDGNTPSIASSPTTTTLGGAMADQNPIIASSDVPRTADAILD